MNFGYLFKDDKSIEDLIGGQNLGKNRAYFEIWQQDEKLLISIASIFELDGIQTKNIRKKLHEISESKEIPDEYFDKLILIENISNRYLMIKGLLSKERDLNFGILGLIFYLGLTCFDSLGQNGNYKTFYEWLIYRNNNHINEIQTRINSNEIIHFKNEIIQLFNNQYNPVFGMRNSFFSFINSIKEKDSFKELFSSIDVTDNLYRKKLEQHNDLELIKSMWMFSFRNDFTHNTRNMRWPIDNNWFYLSFEIQSNSIPISIIPYRLVDSVLKCIKDGIKMKLNELKLFS